MKWIDEKTWQQDKRATLKRGVRRKQTKHAKFFEKYVCVSVGKKYSFFGKFGVLCVFVRSV